MLSKLTLGVILLQALVAEEQLLLKEVQPYKKNDPRFNFLPEQVHFLFHSGFLCCGQPRAREAKCGGGGGGVVRGKAELHLEWRQMLNCKALWY